MATAKEIPPGGEGKIDVTFKTGGGSGGKREKHISVTTNDPDNKNISLAITTIVVEKVGISPERLNFSQVKKGKEHVLYASISGEDKDTTKLTGFDSPNPSITVEINPKGYDGNKDQQIKVTLLPTMRIGRFFERVMLHTDHKDFKDIALNVIGEVTGDVSLLPSQLHFGLFQGGKPVDRVMTVKAIEDITFKILEVKSTVPEVTTSVETVLDGKEYRIHAHLSDTFAGDSPRGTLTIKTDLKNDGIFEVEIAGRKLPPMGSSFATTVPPSLNNGQPSPRPAGNLTVFPPPATQQAQPPRPVEIHEAVPAGGPPVTQPAPPGVKTPQ